MASRYVQVDTATTSTPMLLPRLSKFPPTNAGRIIGFGRRDTIPATVPTRLACRGARDSESQSEPAFLSQEDMSYLVKLGAGSVAGAAVIKYGSALFPEITRPDITQALFTIFLPVIVAVILLIGKSRSD